MDFQLTKFFGEFYMIFFLSVALLFFNEVTSLVIHGSFCSQPEYLVGACLLKQLQTVS
jgi:hypothetical protein